MNSVRTLKKWAALALSALLLAACAPAPSTAAPSKAAASSAAPAKPTAVKIALGSEPDNLDPMRSAATDTSSVMMNVFDGLLGFDTKGEFIPSIAESYTVSPDELTYTFKIKQGIKFHDGKPCNAQDVKYTYETLAGLAGGEALSSTLKQVLAKVEAPDDHTVVMTLKAKDAGFLSKATISIVQKGYDKNASQPIGTGPYKFVEYIKGQKVVLEKNPAYSTMADRKPTVDRVEFVITTDENAKLMALKAGDLDIAGVSATNVSALQKDFTIVQGPQNMVQLLALNHKVKPLDDLRVRQAIAYAINKDEIISAVAGGNGAKVESFLSPSMAVFYNGQVKAYATDIEKAKALLKEAGQEKGFTLNVKVPSNYQFHVDTAQVIKNQLAKIGITVNIQLIEWAQWLDGVYTKRDYEGTIIGHSGKLDPQDFLNRFSTPYGKNYFNFSFPAYDELIVKGSSTSKQEERIKYYKDAQQMLVDQAAAIYIQDPYLNFAVSKRVQGLKIHPVTFFNLCDLSVKA